MKFITVEFNKGIHGFNIEAIISFIIDYETKTILLNVEGEPLQYYSCTEEEKVEILGKSHIFSIISENQFLKLKEVLTIFLNTLITKEDMLKIT